MARGQVNGDSVAESHAEETSFMNNNWWAWKGSKSEVTEPKKKLAIKVIMVNLFKAALSSLGSNPSYPQSSGVAASSCF